MSASRWTVGRILVAACVVALCDRVASAADVVPEASGPSASTTGDSGTRPTLTPCTVPHAPTTVTATGTWILPEQFHDDRGDVEIHRVSFSVSGQYDVRPDLGITWALAADRSHYDFSDPDAVVAGSRPLFSDGNVLSVSPGFVWASSGDTRISATFTVKAAAADGARYSDALTYGLGLNVRRRIQGDRGIVFGLYASTSLAGAPTVIPYVLLDGGPSGRVHLEKRGNGAVAAYDVLDNLSVGLTAMYDSRDYRLSSEDRVPGGIFRDLHVPVGLEIDWRPSCHVKVGLSGGIDAYTRQRFLDTEHHHVFGDHPTNGAWGSAAVFVEF